MQESNGVQSHLNWLSLVQSSRRSGIHTLRTPQINPYCGWECFLRACFDLLTQNLSICDTGGYDAYSLVGDATLVPARKYFTVAAYTVSTSCICPHLITPEARHPEILHHQNRNTQSRVVTCISNTPRTSPSHSTLSPVTSNRQLDPCPQKRMY